MTNSADEEEAALLKELHDAGYAIESLSELLTNRELPLNVIHLIAHRIPTIESGNLRGMYIRALAAKEVKRVPEVATLLVQEFLNEPEVVRKWVIGNTLGVIATRENLNDLLELVKDKRHGIGRHELAIALGKFKDKKAIPVLIEGLEDEEIAGHCVIALGKLRATGALPRLEKMLSHPKTWVRREVKKAIARIEAANKKGASAASE